VRTYYDRRAPEYDDCWHHHVEHHRQEVETLLQTLASLPRAHTLDVACGTGFVTRHLPGEVVGLDQSESMLEIARAQAPDASYLVGDAFELPFEDRSFERIFSGHFYGHLEDDDRARFLAEARRVAPELVVAESSIHGDLEPVGWEERALRDGSRWQVYKRYFEPEELLDELGGGRLLFAGSRFLLVASP
jgi:ubiquinone/menaquinone biosynthesis C-methylase UbiE